MPILERIYNPQMMEVYVNGPRGANRLYIFAGTAAFNWYVTDDDSWVREPLRIPMSFIPDAPAIYEENVVDHVETASLAAIYSRETVRRDAIGFAADSVEGFFVSAGGGGLPDYGITVQLALRGNEVRFYRVSFQFNVLANM